MAPEFQSKCRSKSNSFTQRLLASSSIVRSSITRHYRRKEDCHLINGELYVGQSNSSLKPNLTLRSLYLDPLTIILTNQNLGSSVASSSGINGVWDTDLHRGIVLMTDLKTEDYSILEAVQAQLEPFR